VKPHSYLFIDCRQQATYVTKYLSNLFDTENVVTTFVVNMNSYKRSTTFNRMHLVSANLLDSLLSPSSTSTGEITSVEMSPPPEPVKMIGEKRKHDDNEADDDQAKLEVKQARLALPTEEGTIVLPSETVTLTQEGTRDLGLGMDTDGPPLHLNRLSPRKLLCLRCRL